MNNETQNNKEIAENLLTFLNSIENKDQTVDEFVKKMINNKIQKVNEETCNKIEKEIKSNISILNTLYIMLQNK